MMMYSSMCSCTGVCLCCRCFGYVNYYTEEEAERAASVKQGFKISGVAIKTKGPKVLSRQGHFNTTPPRPDGLNFRPLTDCSFFIMGKKCKKAGTVSTGHMSTCMLYIPTLYMYMYNIAIRD